MRIKKKDISLVIHALMHVKANPIHIDAAIGGWYLGDRSAFIKTHKETIAILEDIIKTNKKDKP